MFSILITTIIYYWAIFTLENYENFSVSWQFIQDGPALEPKCYNRWFLNDKSNKTLNGRLGLNLYTFWTVWTIFFKSGVLDSKGPIFENSFILMQTPTFYDAM